MGPQWSQQVPAEATHSGRFELDGTCTQAEKKKGALGQDDEVASAMKGKRFL